MESIEVSVLENKGKGHGMDLGRGQAKQTENKQYSVSFLLLSFQS